MFEKVNPSHPDKVADRIAGAVVDIAYETQIDPKVSVEVLIGHWKPWEYPLMSKNRLSRRSTAALAIRCKIPD